MQGNLFNRLLERGNLNKVPQVGQGVTEMQYTDRQPFEVTRVSEDGKTFWMKPCDYKIANYYDGYGEVGAVREDAPETECRLNRKGQWCIVMDCISKKTGKSYRGIGGEGGSVFVVLMPEGRKGEAYRCPEI